MIAVLLAKQIVQLFLMMFCGWLLVKTKLLKSSDSRALSVLVVYVICPCTVLNAFQIAYTPETAGNFLLAAGSGIVIHVLLFVLIMILGRTMHLSAVEKASVMYSNAGNLIIPLVSAILGPEWVLYASAFMVVQLFIIWTHGKSMIEGKKSADFRSILTNVNLIACILGLAMFLLRIRLPEILGNTVKTLGSTVGPVSMCMLGMILAGADLGAMVKRKRTWLICFLRMVLTPAVMILIIKFSGAASLSPDGQTVLFISLLATMTPSATTVTQMAQLYDNDAEYASAINTLTTMMCIVTMPLMTMLYYA